MIKIFTRDIDLVICVYFEIRYARQTQPNQDQVYDDTIKSVRERERERLERQRKKEGRERGGGVRRIGGQTSIKGMDGTRPKNLKESSFKIGNITSNFIFHCCLRHLSKKIIDS